MDQKPLQLVVNFTLPQGMSRDPRQVRRNIEAMLPGMAEQVARAAEELLKERILAAQAMGQALGHAGPDLGNTFTIRGGNPGPSDPPDEPWTAMQKASVDLDTARALAEKTGLALDEIMGQEMWQNDLYTVCVRRNAQAAGEGWPTVTHLSIRRNDRGAARDWRHFQRIKNELLGPECEAVELYPADSRLVDAANQFHLWGFAEPGVTFPFGYINRDVGDVAGEGDLHVQRPFMPKEEPADFLPGQIGITGVTEQIAAPPPDTFKVRRRHLMRGTWIGGGDASVHKCGCGRIATSEAELAEADLEECPGES